MAEDVVHVNDWSAGLSSWHERRMEKFRGDDIWEVRSIDLDGMAVEAAVGALVQLQQGLADARVTVETYEDYDGVSVSQSVGGWRRATPEELAWRDRVVRATAEHERETKRKMLANLKAELGE